MPAAHLHVVGGVPDSDEYPASESVTFAGGVDVLDPYLERAAASVCPLLEGSGTRLKVIEALAAGIPVVATSKGVEGLDLSHGRDLLLADDPIDFADGLVDVLSDGGLAESLAEHGWQTVRQRYTWDTVARDVHALAFERLRQRGVLSPSERSAGHTRITNPA